MVSRGGVLADTSQPEGYLLVPISCSSLSRPKQCVVERNVRTGGVGFVCVLNKPGWRLKTSPAGNEA